jgi:hypothetical protein
MLLLALAPKVRISLILYRDRVCSVTKDFIVLTLR